MYQLDLAENAVRDLSRFSPVEQSDILLDLEDLELDPFPPEALPVQNPVTGSMGYFFKTPFYHVSYQVFEADQRILVVGIDRLFGSN